MPAQPMLANPAKSVDDAVARLRSSLIGDGIDPTTRDELPSVLCEAKYDGERVQIHWQRGEGRALDDSGSGWEGAVAETDVLHVFARSTEESTAKFRDVAENAVGALRPRENVCSFILDGEACAVQRVDGGEAKGSCSRWSLRPFQTLSRRARKEGHAMGEGEGVQISASVFAFDLLFLNGKSLVDMSLRERRNVMRRSFVEIPGAFAFAHGSELSVSGDEGRAVLEDSVREVMSGSATPEGVMLKRLDGKSSSYGCGKRSFDWMKLKRDFLSRDDTQQGLQDLYGTSLQSRGSGDHQEDQERQEQWKDQLEQQKQKQLAMEGAVPLSDSLDLVVCGAYWGKGKRAGKYGSFLMALQARPNIGPAGFDDDGGDYIEFETICKLGTGFSDKDLEVLTAFLQEHALTPRADGVRVGGEAKVESEGERRGETGSLSHAHKDNNEEDALTLLRSLGVSVSSRLRPLPDVVIDFRNRPSEGASFVWEVRATDMTPSPVYSAARTVGALSEDRGIGLRFPRFLKQRPDKSIYDATDGSAVKEYLGVSSTTC